MVVGKLSDSDKIEKGMTYIVIVMALGFIILSMSAYLHELVKDDLKLSDDDVAAREGMSEANKKMFEEIDGFDLTGKLALQVATDWMRYVGIAVMIAAIIMFRVDER